MPRALRIPDPNFPPESGRFCAARRNNRAVTDECDECCGPPDAPGACCIAGVCSQKTIAECAASGGLFFGGPCTADTCPLTPCCSAGQICYGYGGFRITGTYSWQEVVQSQCGDLSPYTITRTYSGTYNFTNADPSFFCFTSSKTFPMAVNPQCTPSTICGNVPVTCGGASTLFNNINFGLSRVEIRSSSPAFPALIVSPLIDCHRWDLSFTGTNLSPGPGGPTSTSSTVTIRNTGFVARAWRCDGQPPALLRPSRRRVLMPGVDFPVGGVEAAARAAVSGECQGCGGQRRSRA